MGAGRTELLETLFGVYPERRVRGRIAIGGATGHRARRGRRSAPGSAFVTEDRKTQSLTPDQLSVAHNITLAALGTLPAFRPHSPPCRGVRCSAPSQQLRSRRPSAGARSTSSRAATSRRSSSQVPADPTRRCCCSTSRPAASTSAPRPRSMRYQRLARRGRILDGVVRAAELLAMCDRILVLCEGG